MDRGVRWLLIAAATIAEYPLDQSWGVDRVTQAIDGTGGGGEGSDTPSLRRRLTSMLAKRILSGAYPAGSILPTEARLAAEAGVSRTALREAVRTLAAKGLVVARQRIGTRVCEVDAWNRLDPDVLDWMAGIDPDPRFVRGLIEVRTIIEPAAAEIAAARATGTDLGWIEDAYRRMRENLPGNLEACAAADLDFHLGILRATHNPVMVNLGTIISAALGSVFKMTTSVSQAYQRTIDAHGDVLEAIRLRDGAKAKKHMHSLIALALRDLGTWEEVHGKPQALVAMRSGAPEP